MVCQLIVNDEHVVLVGLLIEALQVEVQNHDLARQMLRVIDPRQEVLLLGIVVCDLLDRNLV